MTRKTKKTLALAIVLGLGAFLRLYRIKEMASFDFDQEYAANFAYKVFHDFPIRMVGQGLSVQGLFMGPWYFYFLTPFYALANFNPIGGALGSILLGLFIIYLYFFVVSSFFNFYAGITVAFIKAVSLLSIQNDWSVVPSYSSEFFVLLTIWSLYKYWNKDTKVFPLLMFSLGMLTSIHPIQFPLYFVVLVFILIKRKLPPLKQSILSFTLFIIPISPLLIFDYIRKFTMTKQIFSMFTSQASGELIHLDRLNMYKKIITTDIYQVLGLGGSESTIALLIFFMLIIYLFIKIKSKQKQLSHLAIISITLSIYVLYYLIYPSHVPEYYLGIFRIFVLIYVGSALSMLYTSSRTGKILFILFVFNILVSNIKQINNLWTNPSRTTLSDKEYIVKSIIADSGDKKIFVSYLTEPGWNFGYPFLFKIFGKVPQRDINDNLIYTIVSPKSLSIDSINLSSGNIGIILPKQKK